MLEKSIIYLLFPTIFSSISVESTLNADNAERMSNKEIIEMGIERVKATIESISIEELCNIVKSGPLLKNSTTAEINSGAIIRTENSENDCDTVNKKNFCLN